VVKTLSFDGVFCFARQGRFVNANVPAAQTGASPAGGSVVRTLMAAGAAAGRALGVAPAGPRQRRPSWSRLGSRAPSARAWSSRRAEGAIAADGLAQRLVASRVARPHAGSRGDAREERSPASGCAENRSDVLGCELRRSRWLRSRQAIRAVTNYPRSVVGSIIFRISVIFVARVFGEYQRFCAAVPRWIRCYGPMSHHYSKGNSRISRKKTSAPSDWIRILPLDGYASEPSFTSLPFRSPSDAAPPQNSG